MNPVSEQSQSLERFLAGFHSEILDSEKSR